MGSWLGLIGLLCRTGYPHPHPGAPLARSHQGQSLSCLFLAPAGTGVGKLRTWEGSGWSRARATALRVAVQSLTALGPGQDGSRNDSTGQTPRMQSPVSLEWRCSRARGHNSRTSPPSAIQKPYQVVPFRESLPSPCSYEPLTPRCEGT